MSLLYFCLHYFFISILYTPCVAPVRFSYFTAPTSTPYAYRRFRTLWRPYPQIYTLMFLRRNNLVDIASTTQKTTKVIVDGELRTPYFMKDYYYDDGPFSLRTKIIYLQEMPVKIKEAQIQLEQILRQGKIKENDDEPIKTPPILVTKSLPVLRTETLTDDTTTEATTTEASAKTACYVCGLNETGLPPSNKCHYAFDSDDLRYLTIRPQFKKHCYEGDSQEDGKKWYGHLYRDGCFKRFLDISVGYTERGCRERKPYVGASFASKRFAKLERVLYGQDEGCVFSPYASLTPFSKSISLYARYHVCVCKGKYCNHASIIRLQKGLWIIIAIMLNFILLF